VEVVDAGARLGAVRDELVTIPAIFESIEAWRIHLALGTSDADAERFHEHGSTGRPPGSTAFVDALARVTGRVPKNAEARPQEDGIASNYARAAHRQPIELSASTHRQREQRHFLDRFMHDSDHECHTREPCPMNHQASLLMRQCVTHDVQRFIVTKPERFDFEPGQAVELAIDTPAWRDEGRPFTPTSLRHDGVLEFTIKRYAEHDGVTQALHELEPGARLQVSAPFGAIAYRGTGVFIAGGAGLTPMIAILRDLARHEGLAGHTLLFSNKTPADIMLEHELRYLLGDRCILTCTQSRGPGYEHGRIDKRLLEAHVADFDQHFYVCGPPGFTENVTETLAELGADTERLVFEH